MRGWSHQPLPTSSVNLSDCNNVKSGGPTSIAAHNPQQIKNWNWTERLVWSGHEMILKLTLWLEIYVDREVEVNHVSFTLARFAETVIEFGKIRHP